jgi:hypothetical protein
LIDRISSRNRDYELCLNANLILLELSDNEHTFGKLAAKQNLEALIIAACDMNNRNQHFALNVLNTLIREFPDYDRSIGQTLALEFQSTIGNHFLDITYCCLLIIRACNDQLGEEEEGEIEY